MKEAAVADSPRETLALARAAAGAVRSLNHATLGGEGLDWPADAYELIGELSLAAAGLTQLLAQAGRLARVRPGGRAARLRRRHRPGRRRRRRPPVPVRRPRVRGRPRP